MVIYMVIIHERPWNRTGLCKENPVHRPVGIRHCLPLLYNKKYQILQGIHKLLIDCG